MRSTASICQSNILAVIRNVSKNSHAQRLETSPRVNIASASWAPAHASTNTHEQRIDRLAWGVKNRSPDLAPGYNAPWSSSRDHCR